MPLHPSAVRALAPVALMAAIFYLSGQESVGPELPAFTRVIAHFTEYFVLAGLWIWALIPALGGRAIEESRLNGGGAPLQPSASAIAVGAAIAFLYAISDEWHQSFVPGRDSDPVDVLVDTLGIAAATGLMSARRAALRRRQTSR